MEINSTFYNLPEEGTLEGWRRSVPDDFRFSVKARRRITHMMKLKDPDDIDRKTSPKEVTADFIYIRLYGPEEAYQGKYTGEQLSGWTGAIAAWTSQDMQVY